MAGLARTACACALLLLVGCGEPEAPQIATLRVEPALFEIEVPATGELKAVQATQIKVPTTLNGAQEISWLQEEGFVEEGDLLARLNDRPMRIEEEEARNLIAKADLQLSAKDVEILAERFGIDNQIDLVKFEKEIAEEFVPKDEAIFSRHEIIDGEINLEFLGTKSVHYQNKLERHGSSSRANRELLELQKKTHVVKKDQLDEALRGLEVRAPHAGVFIYRVNWRGEKTQVGMTLWPSNEFGKLPDLSEMEAKVFVLESEALALAEELPATVRLDSTPGRVFAGRVKSIDTIAKQRHHESPVKYFEVVLSLDETDPAVMKPGSRVQATIHADRQEAMLAIPNQAVFHEGGENWVLVRDGEAFVKRPVTLGKRSWTRSVIAEGLEAGDVIALAEQTAHP